jgi:hypothetical protein
MDCLNQWMKPTVRICCCACLMASLSGCIVTKVATVPMRVGGALTSVVPIVGGPTHKTVDKVADAIDEAPYGGSDD